ncbi:MAG: DUF3617 domain-containing protein [Xanthomonadales bacterium]|jgi:hypothetical protein|nr:DUF3617 domain-containing protein [Xanthomonadales bacterium]MDH3941227.1 DUF3617 domain-containing protein [Xanthomonadales bacterium]MDH3999764.1 DUF3617 domain-containing protein [Xanthomonadales bacterium]
MKLQRYCHIFITCLLIASLPVHAEGIPVEPGLWKMTSTVTMPMLPQPRVTTMTECMTKSEISMDEVGGGDMDPNCSFEMSQVDGNTMKWTVDCPVEGGTSHGEWQATSGGDTVTGEGLLTVSFQGQSMDMTMSWQGERIGECP